MARKASTMIAEDIRKTVTAKDDEQDAVMEEMFGLVDVDGSGEISKDEFAKLYRKIADTVRADVAKEQAIEGELKITKRRANMLMGIACALFLFLGISTAATGVVTFALLQATKEVKVGSDGSLTNPDGSIVRTAGAPLHASKVYPNATDAHMKSVKYLEFNFDAAFTTTGMDMRLQLPVEGWVRYTCPAGNAACDPMVDTALVVTMPQCDVVYSWDPTAPANAPDTLASFTNVQNGTACANAVDTIQMPAARRALLEEHVDNKRQLALSAPEHGRQMVVWLYYLGNGALRLAAFCGTRPQTCYDAADMAIEVIF